MKNETQMRSYIKFLKEEKDKNGKLKPNTKKIKDLIELIKVSKYSTKENVEKERQKIIDELDKKDLIFEEFLLNFKTFKRANESDQRRDVRTIFNDEFGIKKLRDGLRNLNYLLNK